MTKQPLIPVGRRERGAVAVEENRMLTQREIDVASYLGQDESYAEIAASLGISHETVRIHVRNIMKKCGVRTRHAAVVRLLQKGMQITRTGY